MATIRIASATAPSVAGLIHASLIPPKRERKGESGGKEELVGVTEKVEGGKCGFG